MSLEKYSEAIHELRTCLAIANNAVEPWTMDDAKSEFHKNKWEIIYTSLVNDFKKHGLIINPHIRLVKYNTPMPVAFGDGFIIGSEKTRIVGGDLATVLLFKALTGR